MRISGAWIALVLFAGAAYFAGAAAAQAFEAASVKPSDPALRGSSIDNPGGPRFNARGITLKDLLTTAYHLQDLQITGGPPWLASERYDVTATAGFRASPDQVRQMLRTLLADRFKLATHMGTKDLGYYSLTPAKGGPRLTRSEMQDCPDTQDTTHPCGGFRVYQRREVTSHAATMDQFAETLSWLLARVVEDQTGLTGRYDFKLTFSPDTSFGPRTAEQQPAAPPADASDASIFAAMQEQLGLKLESRKGPVPVLVVDRAEKASDN